MWVVGWEAGVVDMVSRLCFWNGQRDRTPSVVTAGVTYAQEDSDHIIRVNMAETEDKDLHKEKLYYCNCLKRY